MLVCMDVHTYVLLSVCIFDAQLRSTSLVDNNNESTLDKQEITMESRDSECRMPARHASQDNKTQTLH